jgi:hypothetical protein
MASTEQHAPAGTLPQGGIFSAAGKDACTDTTGATLRADDPAQVEQQCFRRFTRWKAAVEGQLRLNSPGTGCVASNTLDSHWASAMKVPSAATL